MEYCNVKLTLKAPENQEPALSFNGKVTFNPDIGRGETWHDNGELVPSVRVDAAIVNNVLKGADGKSLVKLMAGGDGVNPEKVHWRIAFDDIYFGEQRVHIDPFIFEAVPGETLDLEKVTPVAGYTPPGIIKGDKGDPGPQGGVGPQGPAAPADGGYQTKNRTDPLDDYPLGYSISLQNSVTKDWAPLWSENGIEVPSFTVVETVVWNRYKEGTARQDLTAYQDGKNTKPILRRYWDHAASEWGPAKLLSANEPNTDIIGYSSADHAGKLVRINSQGGLRIYTASITNPTSPANKAYVDSRIQVVSSLPSNPDSNTLYVIPE